MLERFLYSLALYILAGGLLVGLTASALRLSRPTVYWTVALLVSFIGSVWAYTTGSVLEAVGQVCLPVLATFCVLRTKRLVHSRWWIAYPSALSAFIVASIVGIVLIFLLSGLGDELLLAYYPALYFLDAVFPVALVSTYFIKWWRGMPAWKAWLRASAIWLLIAWSALYFLGVKAYNTALLFLAVELLAGFVPGIETFVADKAEWKIILLTLGLPSLFIVAAPTALLMLVRKRSKQKQGATT